MLQNIRDRFTGPTALIVLGLIAIPFIFVGVSSPLIGSGWAAKVDGDEISLSLFENTWQTQLGQNPQIAGYPAVYQNALRQQVLDQMIQERLVDAYLDDSGMRISDSMVTDLVQQIPDYQVDGEFSIDLYRETLGLEGRTPADFERGVNQSLRQYQLQQAIATTAFVTPSEYRRYLNLFAERRQVTVATLEFAAIKDGIEVTEEEIAEFYESRPDEFFTAETADLEYIEVRRDSLAQNAVISDEELQAHYEDSRNRYLQDEQRRASHILLPFGEDEAATREQAKALAARVQAGEPFDDLARQHSKDGMTANNGGDLGLIPQSQMPDALGDAIFSMRKSEVRGPVRSDFGFHVVRLNEIVEGGPLPLDQVRPELERELRDRKSDAEFRAIENGISNALFEALDIQAMAESVGLEVGTAAGFMRSGGEPFGANQAVIETVFDSRVLNDGEISDIVEIDANRSVILRVALYHEAVRKPLDEVKSQISGALQSARAQDIIAQRSEELQNLLRGGATMLVAAEQIGAMLSAPMVVARASEDADARLLGAIFRTKKPIDGQIRIGSAVTQEGDYAVFSLTAVAPGRPESIPLADRDARKQELANQSGVADFTAFISELQARADIVKNDDILQSDDTFQ